MAETFNKALADVAGEDLNTDAAVALKAKIFRILEAGTPNSSHFLSYCAVGLPMTDEMLKFLKDPDPESEATFAMQANGIPAGSGNWSAGTTRVWNVYRQWLESYEYPPNSPTPEEKEKLEAAIKTYNDNLKVYVDARAVYNEAVLDKDLLQYTPKDMRGADWYKAYMQAEQKVTDAMSYWMGPGQKDTVEGALVTMTDLGRRDPARVKQVLTDQLGLAKKYANISYYPTSLYPSNFWRPEVEWPKFKMDSKNIREYKSDRTINFGGKGSVDYAGFSAEIDAEGEIIYNTYELDLEELQVEFEMTRATILRPWFDPFLMFSRAWKNPGQTPDNRTTAMYSDGRIPPSPECSIPFVPTEVVFVRKVRVRFNKETTNNKKFLLDIKGGASVGFGPLKLSGTIKWNEQEIKMDTKVSNDSVECDNMQIIGFFCQVVPEIPNPDWSLWPA